MSNTRAIIDYAMNDNGKEVRDALYAEIHDRVMSHIEAKKMELAGGLLHTEAKCCSMSDKMEKTSKKINKLKEEIAILEEYLQNILSEESSCDDMDADDVSSAIEKKKKKLKKAKKKMKKMKEEFSLSEEGEVDEEGEWNEEEDSEEDEVSEEE